MKIRRVTRSVHNFFRWGVLSNVCREGSEIANTTGIMVGSVLCDQCPLRWFHFMGLVFCHKNKKQKPAHKESEKGTPAIHLVKDEVINA